mmetsp:Transcript_12432/g.35828  ORF Transcript_12432/g.35828 Transcript_12432/m.35828 type:complete len:87 (-) Transcript_12432:63-323(-)
MRKGKECRSPPLCFGLAVHEAVLHHILLVIPQSSKRKRQDNETVESSVAIVIGLWATPSQAAPPGASSAAMWPSCPFVGSRVSEAF